jgi:transposase
VCLVKEYLMLLPALFPQVRGLRVEHLRTDADNGLTVVMTTTQPTALCPLCQSLASRVHSRYQRRVTDLPCSGRTVTLLVHARRFFCRNDRCPRKTFRGRLAILAAPRARFSHNLRATLAQVGIALGGEAGARLALLLGMPVSADTLLRLVHALPVSSVGQLRIVGIDDWAWKKGRRYGTILCDLERHRPVDLLPERSADSVAAWLTAHPGITLISRDRSDLYADGASRGAPDAIQVADRFHLIKNLGDALDRFLQHKRTILTQVDVLAHPPMARPSPKQPWQLRAEADSQRRHAPVLARYEAVLALHAKDADVADIARAIGISRTTVYRYLHLGGPPERKEYRSRATVLDPYKTHLLARWDEGCHTATRLWREIRAMGYQSSYTNVVRFLVQLRLPVGERPSVYRDRISAHRPPTPRHVAILFVRRPETLTTEEQQEIERLCQADSTIARIYALTQDFVTMAHARQGDGLDAWVAAASASASADLRRFAAGLLLDEAAVQAGLTLEWSNGQTEGQINRLKTVKRQMYGRAGFGLLRQRVLNGA